MPHRRLPPALTRLAPILAVLVLAHFAWFVTLRPLTAGDWGFYHREIMLDLASLSRSWTAAQTVGSSDPVSVAFSAFLLLFGGLGRAGMDFALAERLIFFWPAALLPAITMYYLVSRVLTRKAAIPEFSALLYALNSYLLLIKTVGHLTVAMAYALMPWALASFVLALRCRSFKQAVVAGLATSLLFVFEPRMGYITLGILGLYLGFFLFVEDQSPWRSHAGRSLTLSLVSFLIVGLVQLVWILPTVAERAAGLAAMLPSQPWTSFVDIVHALAFYHPFWTGGEPTLFVVQPVPFLALVLPLLALLPLLVKNKPKSLLFFVLIGLVGVFLTKQDNPPLAPVYTWLFEHVPGFQLFRDGSKFYLPIALSYSVLLGAFLRQIGLLVKPYHYGTLCSRGLNITCLALILLTAKPAFQNELGGTFTPVEVPAEHLIWKDHVLAQPDELFRTLWIPETPRFGFYSEAFPAISISAGNRLARPFVQLGLDDPEQLRRTIALPTLRPLLNLLSVRFVVVSMEKDGSSAPDPQAEGIIAELDRHPWLTKVDRNDALVAYETESYLPRIYAAPAVVVLDADLEEALAILNEGPYFNDPSLAFITRQDLAEGRIEGGVAELHLLEVGDLPEESPQKVPELSYRRVTPTRYEVSVQANDSFWLILSESFHPGWQAFAQTVPGQEEPGSAMASKPSTSRQLLPEAGSTWYDGSNLLAWLMHAPSRTPLRGHYLVNSYANGWYVPNSGMATISLEYVPQRSFELGALVAAATTLICIGMLGWAWMRGR